MSIPTPANLYTQGYGSRPENVEIPVYAYRNPTSNDVNYPLGKRWINLTVGSAAEFVLLGLTTSAGITTPNWQPTAGASSELSTLTDTTGTVVYPAAGNIQESGTANQITVTAGTNKLTWSLPAAITAPGSLTTTTSLSATTTVTAGTGITSTTGDIVATAGNVQAGGNVIATKSSAGATVSVQCTNSDNTNSASDSQVQIAVGGPSGGSPSLALQVSGAANDNWAIGADNANSYRLAISDGGVLGTSDVLRISHTSGNVEVVSGNITVTAGNISTTAGSITSATTVTATSGNITATSGNVVMSAVASGIVTNPTTASGASSGTVNCNGRVGSVTFTGPSIAAGATASLVVGNTSITGSSTIVLYSMRGATTGAAICIQSVTNAANQSTIVVENGTGATTQTGDLTFDFIVLN